MRNIPRREERKAMVPGPSGLRMVRQGSDASVTGAGHIHTDDEILSGVKKLAFAHHTGPPLHRVTISRDAMKDPDHVGTVFVDGAMGGIGQMESGDACPGLQLKWPVILKNLKTIRHVALRRSLQKPVRNLP